MALRHLAVTAVYQPLSCYVLPADFSTGNSRPLLSTGLCMLVVGTSLLRKAADLSRPISGPFSGSLAGNIDSFIMRLRACSIRHMLSVVGLSASKNRYHLSSLTEQCMLLRGNLA